MNIRKLVSIIWGSYVVFSEVFILSVIICCVLLNLNLGMKLGLLFLGNFILIFFFCNLGFVKEMVGVVFFLVFFDLLKWKIDFLIIGI